MDNRVEKVRAVPTRAALERAWVRFLDANQDGIISPDEYPGHALITFRQMVDIMTEAAELDAEHRAALTTKSEVGPIDDEIWRLRAENTRLKEILDNPPRHRFWGAGEPDCPREIKAGNGELHTLRCKVCGIEHPRDDFCRAAMKPADDGWRSADTAPKTGPDLVAQSFLAWCPDEDAPGGGDQRIVWWEPKLNGGCWYGDRDLVETFTYWKPLELSARASLNTQEKAE